MRTTLPSNSINVDYSKKEISCKKDETQRSTRQPRGFALRNQEPQWTFLTNNSSSSVDDVEYNEMPPLDKQSTGKTSHIRRSDEKEFPSKNAPYDKQEEYSRDESRNTFLGGRIR